MRWKHNSLILLLFPVLLCSCDTLQQKVASIQASETVLFEGIGNLMLTAQPSPGVYSFEDIGALDNRSNSYNKVWSMSRIRIPELSSLVRMGTFRLYLRERISPQGVPGVQVEFSCSVEFHDVEMGRLASSREFSHSVTLPLPTWVEGGESGIFAEIGESMQVIAAKVAAALNE